MKRLRLRHRPAGRLEAREMIVAAAEKHRYGGSMPITMRHLQRAVCICRRNRLVDADVLVAAGFNPEKRR